MKRVELASLCLCALLLAVSWPALAEDPPLCPQQPNCGSGEGRVNCSNTPYEPMACWPTSHGPARADVVEGPKNMLFCRGGVYALCFYSGPKRVTGLPDKGNVPLPCIVGPKGDVANCTCKAFRSGPEGDPYFVDINSILNQGAYFDTVVKCDSDGGSCKNLANCGSDGSGKTCDNYKFAPVCAYVAAQDPNRPETSLIPKADLISAFSFAMAADYGTDSTTCDDQPYGTYAGCMTAPCRRQSGSGAIEDGELVDCACPTWQGPFQVGQKGPAITCQPASVDGVTYTWSASYTSASSDE